MKVAMRSDHTRALLKAMVRYLYLILQAIGTWPKFWRKSVIGSHRCLGQIQAGEDMPLIRIGMATLAVYSKYSFSLATK